MCTPLVGAVAGVAQSVGGYVSQQSQVNAANAAATQDYEYQLQQREQDWMSTLGEWGQRRLEYEKTLSANQEAAYGGYAQEQQRLNEVYKEAAFANQASLIGLMQGMGQYQARGVSGQSASRGLTMMQGAYGRNQAIQQESLRSARNRFTLSTEGIRRDLTSANNQAFSNVALAPVAGVAPPPPTMVENPSPFGLIAGIGSSVAPLIGKPLFSGSTPSLPGGNTSTFNLNSSYQFPTSTSFNPLAYNSPFLLSP